MLLIALLLFVSASAAFIEMVNLSGKSLGHIDLSGDEDTCKERFEVFFMQHSIATGFRLIWNGKDESFRGNFEITSDFVSRIRRDAETQKITMTVLFHVTDVPEHLVAACCSGHVADRVSIVTQMLENDEIEWTNFYEFWEALEAIFKARNLELISIFQEYILRIKKTDELSRFAHKAYDNHYINIIEELLNMNKIDSQDFLIDGNQSVDMVRLLLEHGHRPDKEGGCPRNVSLLETALSENVEIMEVLLGVDGIDIDVYLIDIEETALYYAARNKNETIARLLLKYGASPEKLRYTDAWENLQSIERL